MSKEFDKIMGEQGNIALATCVDGTPNVRIVTYYREASRPGVLLFCTDRDNDKVREFASNNRVAFSSLPEGGIAHARSHDALVQKSPLSVHEVRDLFSRIPGYRRTLEELGEVLDLYEIHVSKAVVILGFEEAVPVSF